MRLQEESLDSSVSKVAMNPLDCREAENHVEVSFLSAQIFDVVLADEMHAAT